MGERGEDLDDAARGWGEAGGASEQEADAEVLEKTRTEEVQGDDGICEEEGVELEVMQRRKATKEGADGGGLIRYDRQRLTVLAAAFIGQRRGHHDAHPPHHPAPFRPQILHPPSERFNRLKCESVLPIKHSACLPIPAATHKQRAQIPPPRTQTPQLLVTFRERTGPEISIITPRAKELIPLGRGPSAAPGVDPSAADGDAVGPSGTMAVAPERDIGAGPAADAVPCGVRDGMDVEERRGDQRTGGMVEKVPFGRADEKEPEDVGAEFRGKGVEAVAEGGRRGSGWSDREIVEVFDVGFEHSGMSESGVS